MSLELHHECTRVPVTGLFPCGSLVAAAEGPILRFYDCRDFTQVCSRQVFVTQAIHGISTFSSSSHHVTLIVWGGPLVRTLDIQTRNGEKGKSTLYISGSSNVAKAPDWILDLCPAPVEDKSSSPNTRKCAAVTAHNALLELTVTQSSNVPTNNNPVISIAALTSSSRSILYSAHLIWDDQERILVAAGTAFGEIMYWSWTRNPDGEPHFHTHQVFLGHEGSVFGVQISGELEMDQDGRSQRLLASCSDDRTIRIWDVTDRFESDEQHTPQDDLTAQRKQHTGFSNASFDPAPSSSDCLAIGWGHTSRVWTVRFLDNNPSTTNVGLLSSGEDATSRTWQLVPNKDNVLADTRPYRLLQLDSAEHHSGKNVWSVTVCGRSSEQQQVVIGGADSKITICFLGAHTPLIGGSRRSFECTVAGISSSALAHSETLPLSDPDPAHRSSKLAEFFRSYAFIDDASFLLTTNSGKVYVASVRSDPGVENSVTTPESRLIELCQNLSGYSICTGIPALGLVFVAGAQGSIYMYHKKSPGLTKLHAFGGKVGAIFAVKTEASSTGDDVVLFVTLVGQKVARLLYVTISIDGVPLLSASIPVSIPELHTGLTVTSIEYAAVDENALHLFLGFRHGSIAIYRMSSNHTGTVELDSTAPAKIIEKAHGREAVTSMRWIPVGRSSSLGNLVSTGRDGRLTIHTVDIATNSTCLSHNLLLPISPNIEGIHFNGTQLQVHGFSSKRFIVYDTITEEEILGVDTGGAHRSWAYHPSSQELGGGTMVWTRASSMHICHQVGSGHQVIRSGGHGRELKAVAISTIVTDGVQRQLIATGAEDTDIKLFEYEDSQLVCRRTLRKHKTGIQHLRWSDDGTYLFSSGGCEEFYIWRVRILPPQLGGIGVVCEAVHELESEHSDLRIMSFDILESTSSFVIAMVFSDSNIRVYSYDPTSAGTKWQTLAHGVYFTSCLTQCVFLSPKTILTAGTDGHAVLWPLAETAHPVNGESLSWKHPARIHQSSSKTLATQKFDDTSTLIVSGGDDGSLSFLLASASPTSPVAARYAYPPIIVTRTHASAVTACAILTHRSRIFVLTSGNDQWVRLWEVTPREPVQAGVATTEQLQDPITIKRVRKIKTNVADVSSMAVLRNSKGEEAIRVLICGVGMEVIRVRGEGMQAVTAEEGGI